MLVVASMITTCTYSLFFVGEILQGDLSEVTVMVMIMVIGAEELT